MLIELNERVRVSAGASWSLSSMTYAADLFRTPAGIHVSIKRSKPRNVVRISSASLRMSHEAQIGGRLRQAIIV